MNCLSATFKYLLYLLNLIFVAGGILLIVVGSITLSQMGDFNSFDGEVSTATIPIIIIVIGCVTFVVAFFGCCGTIRENPCCTTIYAICMLILFGLQLALSIWMFAANDKFMTNLEKVVDKAWNENNAAQGYPMDALQLALKCCGKNGYNDYNGAVPASCCGYSDRNQACEADIYSQRPGCQAEFMDFWEASTELIRWSSLIIALFELGIFIMSCCLASAMRKR
ncbi:23 kDa integral membrane protein-like [Drosophila elegans]|uniref:23 kDa integral membrane protein-like n=1 Tax=Drosophila elegans TaxID=30023 RepID=UPI0007E738FD|nr:23 kDa integral membrane protein-like [Drosophila elegans]